MVPRTVDLLKTIGSISYSMPPQCSTIGARQVAKNPTQLSTLSSRLTYKHIFDNQISLFRNSLSNIANQATPLTTNSLPCEDRVTCPWQNSHKKKVFSASD